MRQVSRSTHLSSDSWRVQDAVPTESHGNSGCTWPRNGAPLLFPFPVAVGPVPDGTGLTSKSVTSMVTDYDQDGHVVGAHEEPVNVTVRSRLRLFLSQRAAIPASPTLPEARTGRS